MPLLVMHGGIPAVAIANKTTMAKTVSAQTGKEDKQDLILKKLTAIEAELGITPPEEMRLTEDEIMRRQMFVEKMAIARQQKKAESELAMQEAERKKKEFLKRMKKGKKKAAKARGE